MRSNSILHSISYHRYLLASVVFSIALILWRVFYTGESTYLFLVWNLILALIPFAISELGFSYKVKALSLRNMLPLGLCVLFLPNSPYILTDLFHLRWHREPAIWYDTVLIVSFALNGLLMFFHTLINMDNMLLQRFGRWTAWVFKLGIIFLCGFGIYLGRYLRFNSWDIISNPEPLIYEIAHRLIHPLQHPLTWSMTTLYALFLGVIYLNFLGFQRGFLSNRNV